MTRTSPWRLLATTALIILSGSMSQAQEIARAFDQLPAVAKAGDAVTVTDAGGGQTIGRVLQFTSTTLGILTMSGRRDLSEADVMTIVRRGHGDPGTGARWGLGVGAAIGLLFTAGSFGSGCYDCLWEVALGGAMFAGIGAGAGTSASIPIRQVVYMKGNAGSTTLTVAPFVDRDRKGMRMALRF
jgi:hypothetical protein